MEVLRFVHFSGLLRRWNRESCSPPFLSFHVWESLLTRFLARSAENGTCCSVFGCSLTLSLLHSLSQASSSSHFPNAVLWYLSVRKVYW
ncbi:hypothetical protein VTK26DRAFT_4778 [Humicola hyalothermophila]